MKMVYFSCITGCKKGWHRGCGLSFHMIPYDALLADRWKKNIPGKVTKISVDCNLHVKDEDFINQAKRTLRPDATSSI